MELNSKDDLYSTLDEILARLSVIEQSNNEKTKDERHAFKEEAMPNGKYNHLKARKYFYEKYFPEYIPKAEPITLKSKAIANW